MKKVLILCLVLFSFNNMMAQKPVYNNAELAKPPGYHKHDGFYLSMCYGAVFGNILDEYNSTTMDMSGIGT